MSKRIYLVYALTDPREDYRTERFTIAGVPGVRYVGQTFKSAKHRLREHLSEEESNTYKVRWIRKLRTLGLTPDIQELSRHDSSQEVDAEEKRLIAIARQQMGPKCLNLTEGGQGGYYTEEQMAALRHRGLPGNTPYDILHLAVSAEIRSLMLRPGERYVPQIRYTVERSHLKQLSTIKVQTTEYRRGYHAAVTSQPLPATGNRRSQAGYLHGLLYLAGHARRLDDV